MLLSPCSLLSILQKPLLRRGEQVVRALPPGVPHVLRDSGL